MRWFLALIAVTCASAQSLSLRRPAPQDTRPGVTAIDAFVEQHWREHSIKAPEPISGELFARRAYLDIWGIVPTPQQLNNFKSSPDRAALIDRLLADSRNYTEHWISFWNDLLRNDEGVVYHGERKSITTWLRKALEENLPYDRFISALINPAAQGDPEGFLIGVNWRGEVNASELPPMQAAQNSAQVFLGVNLKCNSCHDSFISKWKLKDAYGLASFFSDGPLELVRCDVKMGETAAPKFLFPELGSPAVGTSLADRRAAAARLFTSPENGRLPRTLVNRVWKRLVGRGLVEPVDDMSAKAWSDDLLDWLAADFADHGYDVKHLLRTIMTSRAYQSPAVDHASKPYVFTGPLVRRLTAEQFADSVASITGEWRVKQTGTAGAFVREWQVKSNPMTRALGRPIRDQVTTDRLDQPTTLQALELTNGVTLATALLRSSQRMLGELKAPPANLFDSGVVNAQRVPVDIDITGASKLWLLIEDSDSYDRTRVVAGWLDAELTGPAGTVKLADLVPKSPRRMIQPRKASPGEAITGPLSSRMIVDLGGKPFTRFRGAVAIDESCLISEINPRARFFVFREEPDPQLLVRVVGDPPAPVAWKASSLDQTVDMLYRHALARPPAPAETKVARSFFNGKLSADGLEDLLWAVFLSPEFQYIR
jgi:uncharacterized protein DUF1549/uncharacterized protein DUF1553